MKSISIIRELITDELLWRTNLSDETINKISENVIERVISKRYTLLPSYLTDDMYNVQREIYPNITYNKANEMYRAAMIEYHTPIETNNSDIDDDGSFW